MFNRLKISFVIVPLAIVLIVAAYIYSLWAADRDKTNDLPIEAVAAMTRDFLSFHEKRGAFPADFSLLESVVWERKQRTFSINNRAYSHRNYYYFYSRINEHLFTLWAIPTGSQREESPAWFVVVTPNVCRRFKGAALPFEQVDRIEANPTLKKLGAFGLVEQPAIDLKNRQTATGIFGKN